MAINNKIVNNKSRLTLVKASNFTVFEKDDKNDRHVLYYDVIDRMRLRPLRIPIGEKDFVAKTRDGFCIIKHYNGDWFSPIVFPITIERT